MVGELAPPAVNLHQPISSQFGAEQENVKDLCHHFWCVCVVLIVSIFVSGMNPSVFPGPVVLPEPVKPLNTS